MARKPRESRVAPAHTTQKPLKKVFCFLLLRFLRASESKLSFCRSYGRTPSPIDRHHDPTTSLKPILLHRYSMNSSPGASLVSGIQDISAFLPVIGTEQRERHVGEALDGGFLYAAATPLSLFGSLGIVESGTAILCASVSARTARLLAAAGFNLEGSVSAMMGSARSQRGPSTSRVVPVVRTRF
jgi:hypothetical protein